MANLSEDIQCAGFDTSPPMLDRTDFKSWQQRICLYCLGKDNGVNILKSINEGPFKIGKFREINFSEVHLSEDQKKNGIEIFADLTPEEKRAVYAYLKQHEAHANESKMMLERYTKHAINPLALVSNVSPHQYPSQSSTNPQSAYVPPGNYARGAVTAGNGVIQNRVGNANAGQAKQIKCYNYNGENGVVLDEEQLLFIAGGQTNTFDDVVDEAPVQDLALNEDNIFQADQCDDFDSDFDEAPTAQTMFMENLSSVDPIFDEASPSYDSNILSEVQDHDNYVDSVGEYHEVHEMQYYVQPNYVVDSDAKYTSDSNIILYEQYVKNNAVQVVQSNNKVVNESLTAELARYKEQVELYKKRASYELVKTTHAPAVVHDSEDTLELAKTTRMKMLKKSKSNMWVDSKIKIAPPDYLKEDYLATLTPHRHLILEHIFWSEDVHKHLTNVPKPITALMVYPSNTPAKLVPMIL
ncbi:hypothetical protein Tco_0669981 [Tanacetum coccineum]